MLAPALIEVGVRWEAGDVTVAQEHLATSTVRAAMQRLLADARADVRGVAVLACAPGEQHEIGLLMLAVLLRADGWQVAYLGADTPVLDAVELARVIGASALCFSAGTSEGAEALEAELTHVPTSTTVMLGGRGTDSDDAASVVRFAPPAGSVSRGRSALAGAAAAGAWAAVEPLDRRVLRNDYSDVAMLGKLVTRSRAWPVAGLALHAANGALFGLAFERARERTGSEPRRVALGLALAENFALFPLAAAVDRLHPARGERGLAPLFTARGLAQATFRHALFGAVLGRLAR